MGPSSQNKNKTKTFCIDTVTQRKKKKLQKGKQNSLTQYSCTFCFIPSLLTPRNNIPSLAGSQQVAPALTKSPFLLCTRKFSAVHKLHQATCMERGLSAWQTASCCCLQGGGFTTSTGGDLIIQLCGVLIRHRCVGSGDVSLLGEVQGVRWLLCS